MSPGTPFEVFTVSRLNRQAKQLLESHFTPVWVEAEISNFKLHTSGHMYFILKDERAALAAAMFASHNVSLNFTPADGQKVLARGILTLYESRGQYQLVVQNLYPSGAGELWLAFEALKTRLQNEGLFDPARKKPLPTFPRRIGVVTSPVGAAITDIMQIIGRRAPQVVLVVRPTLVQGGDAAEEIAAALDDFAAYERVDLVILARGGGSLEDLWPFNEEVVARAVAACPLPTISAVGHESDITICDLVADLRASTPSAAAELAVEDRRGYLQLLDERASVIDRQLRRQLQAARQQLDQLRQHYAFRRPLTMIEQQRDHLDWITGVLQVDLARLLERKALALELAVTGLHALSPRNVLDRGYTIVTDDRTGRVISAVDQLQLRQALTLHLKDGSAGAEVTRLEEN